jgi:hypothetical protein
MGSMIELGTSGVTAGIWTVKQSWAVFSVPVFPVPRTGVPEILPLSHTVVPGDSVIVRNVVNVPLFGAGFSPVSDGVPRSLPDPSCDFQGSRSECTQSRTWSTVLPVNVLGSQLMVTAAVAPWMIPNSVPRVLASVVE